MTMFASQWLANPDTGYTIDQSIRFNRADSAYLTRTPSSASNRRTFTLSFWWKMSTIPSTTSGGYRIIQADSTEFGWSDSNNNLYLLDGSTLFQTSQVFRDPSAWQHIVLAVDTTDATAGNRIKLYINGSEVTDFASGPSVSQNFDFDINNTVAQNIGKQGSNYIGAYVAEFHSVDGTQLNATSFGETNSTTGQWVPVKYAGSYGTNGFYLKGQDSSALGDDSSGNGNDFTSSGLAAADQMLDTPTANLPTFNPLSKGSGTLSDGNLQYVGVGSWTNVRLNLLLPETGKWAVRFKTVTSYQQIMVGVCAPDSATTYGDLDANGVAMLRYNTQDGNFVTRVGGSRIADTGPPAVAAQTYFQLLFDMDAGLMGVAADGATSGTFADISTYSIMDLNGASLSTARQIFALVYSGSGASGAGAILDAGQSGWEPTVTGFSALTLANLPDPTIADGSEYFHPQLYTGTGSSGLAITNVASAGDFKPDILWLSPRSNGDNKVFFDSVRGTTQRLKGNSSDAEDTDGTAQITFETDGFDLDTTDVNFNGSSRTYVAWQWKTTGGTTSSNTDGNITSTVSASPTSGVAVLTYSGNGSDNQTIGHGIGIAPKMIITKRRNSSGNWTTYHDAVGINKVFYLNSTAAASSNTEQYRATPTSSVYTVGVGGDINNSSGTYVAFVFAEVDGFSKIGSYEGNGSTDGPFVYTGFKPRWVMIKRYDSTESWPILDTARGSGNFGSAAGTGGTDPTAGNDLNAVLVANTSAAEEDNPTGSRRASYLSNGFQVRTTNTAMNASGGDYLYLAFAECPFKTATAR